MREEPFETYIIAENHINPSEFAAACDDLQIPEWKTDAPSDNEFLVEFAGRLCYKSFNTKLNPNVTRIREGNADYLHNIAKQQHGSVYEHTASTVLFRNVSRILTHELVRHRVGIGYSQESMRFVRFDDCNMYIPECIEGDFAAYDIFCDAVEAAEEAVQKLYAIFNLEDEKVPFKYKKEVTSAIRRIAPGGVTTDIIATANHRTWRHIFCQRIGEGVEEEIREVMNKLLHKFTCKHPHLYQDAEVNDETGLIVLTQGAF